MRKTRYLYRYLFITFIGVFGLFPRFNAAAQTPETDAAEVYLDFRYRGAINTVVITYFKDGFFFLPFSELFEHLQYDYNTRGLVISGRFGREATPYELNFNNGTFLHQNKSIPLLPEEYLVTDLDFYLPLDIFSELFGLNFSVDFNNLSLQLETDQEVPAVEKALRRLKRDRAQQNRFERKQYDLRFGRNRTLLDGGFLDYNLTANLNQRVNSYSYSTAVGLQVAGGDLQGTVFGNYSENYATLNSNSFRWRYYVHNRPALSQIILGQAFSDGVIQNPYTGIRLSNEPIEPRYEFDEFEIQGHTMPESEVELYLNNMLIDFQQADALGQYRFLAPVSYGSSQYDLKIYGPTGQIIQRSSRVQVPFNFQPSGAFNYTLNAGRLDVPLLGQTDRSTMLQGRGAYGINEWLTLRAGTEYYQNQNNNNPFLTASVSTRVLSKYIFSFEGVTNAYYRAAMNVIYANSASINFDYTSFTRHVNIYNISGDDKRIIASAFFPFIIKEIPFNIRVSSFSNVRAAGSSTIYRADLNSRLGKLNLRAGYSDRSAGVFNPFGLSPTSNLDLSATYSIANNPNLPRLIRGFYLRSGVRYLIKQKQLETVDFSVSRSIFRKGKLQLLAGRNFINKFNSLRFNLVFDFNTIRTGSTFSSTRNTTSFTQNVRGSIGYDSNYNNFLFTSREQVGRAAAAVKLFVDNDNSGAFNPDTDETIISSALRADRTGTSSTIKNGVLYLSQMQPYYFYNIDFNKSALTNPMLVPDFDKFGMITDPNQYKKIEIPLYMSGVIEGKVERGGEAAARGIGGLKLVLESVSTDFSQEIRTFGDGSFYAYEIPPGDYRLFVDGQQLSILGMVSDPEIVYFEIKPVTDGDFIEGLNLTLKPYTAGEPEEDNTDTAAGGDALRLIIKAQNEFYAGNFEAALDYVQKSLDAAETSQGYALKGSLLYLSGNTDEAGRSWNKATEINPDIIIPDIKTLDNLIHKDFKSKNED